MKNEMIVCKAHLDIDQMPDTAFVRANALFASGFLPFSKSTLWRLVKAGHFPTPTKLSDNITAWNVGALKRWHAAKTANPAEIAKEGALNVR